MIDWQETGYLIRTFFVAGGPVLVLLSILCLALWILIITRYWYIKFEHPKQLQNALRQLPTHIASQDWHKNQVRLAILSELSLKLRQNLRQIQTLIQVAPLFGLLGTIQA